MNNVNIMKFSNRYKKMPKGWQISRLLEVFEKDFFDLSEEYIEYDTSIYDSDEKYQLPPTKLLVLLLQSSKDHVWTTIRKCTEEKKDYYMLMRGQTIYCKIEIQPE